MADIGTIDARRQVVSTSRRISHYCRDLKGATDFAKEDMIRDIAKALSELVGDGEALVRLLPLQEQKIPADDLYDRMRGYYDLLLRRDVLVTY